MQAFKNKMFEDNRKTGSTSGFELNLRQIKAYEESLPHPMRRLLF